MLKRLRLKYFKNFKDAELILGRFTLLIGANAAGKSNLCDAIRVLAGIGRGYSLPEVFGEKRGPGGDLVWSGIRGGMANAVFTGYDILEIHAAGEVEEPYEFQFEYLISITTYGKTAVPTLYEERLVTNGETVFSVVPQGPTEPNLVAGEQMTFSFSAPWTGETRFTHFKTIPVLPGLSLPGENFRDECAFLHNSSERTASFLASTQFIDFAPDSLRLPSPPGLSTLDAKGENLSSVLMGLCEDEGSKQTILEWLKALTPMDVVDLRFPKYSAGRVQLALVEAGGTETPAESASDGTLRFLGFLAQMLSARENSMIVFEEVEAGIHPLRLHVLVDLIERTAAERKLQIIATTHSPQLLQYLSTDSLETTSLVYREPEKQSARIVRVLDIPNARETLQHTPISELASGSWLEDAVFFSEETPER